MQHAARKLAFLAIGLVGILLIVGMPSWGQDAVEPSGEIAAADCYGHHKQEGFRSMDLFPQAVTQVPKAQKFDFQLTISNPWLHDLQRVQAYVNISDAPGLEFPGAKAPENVTKDIPISAQPTPPTGPPTGGPAVVQAGTASQDIVVEPNATEMVVTAIAVPGQTQPAVQQRSDIELTVTSPDGQAKIKDDTQKAPATPGVSTGRQSQLVRVDSTNLTRVGGGTWKATLKYQGLAPTATYKFTAVTYYNLSQSRELVLNGPALLQPGQQFTFTFGIVARDVQSLQAMRYGGRANAHHVHTDKAIGDDGTYDKWNTLTFETGTQLIVGNQVLSADNVNLLEPVFRRWGQVLGLAGSFLIIPSLVFGGTFGRKSVDITNVWFGGARRRVLFHNSLSFWLLGIALLHMFIMFYEAFWNWSHGLVWGGLTLACMIGLGVTGATQRQFVARWGFTRWRFIHFAMGVLVVVFVLIHMTADGSHFAPIREFLFGKDPSRIG